MKFFVTYCFVFFTLVCNAQLLSWSPNFISETSSSVEISMNATYGNKALKDYTNTTDVYVHIGAITNLSSSSSDWKYVKFTWGTTASAAQCSFVGSNVWKYSISTDLRTFFGITNSSEKILKIAILFRNGSGNLVQRNIDASDMYVPVYDNTLSARIDNPFKQPTYSPIPEPLTVTVGNNLSINAKSNQPADLKLYFNGTQISNLNNANEIATNTTIVSGGQQTIVVEATASSVTKYDTLKFFINVTPNIAALPSGVKDGINYEPGDTSVTLVLFAPNKSNVSLIGDFNNWTQTIQHQLNKTPDGNRFWIRLTGLTPSTEYAYQYIIDGSIKVADYYTEKVLDPWNDSYIPATTYPSLKPYPTGLTTGIVSIIQTAKPTYIWQVSSFNKPNKSNLIIHEMLLRDFVATQNWQTVTDTLNYLKNLGINAIEIMPLNEFEGNSSWGYNPSYYFAPDKNYGTENALKKFIDECHKKGIAVIMDIALNHSFGSAPTVQMYWNSTLNRPAANNPWHNEAPKHAYNVGFDFNHESQATKDLVARVLEHWLVKYKIDGFRFDLSKGFTQNQTCDANGNNCNVGAWGNYDASRIAILQNIYDKMQLYAPNSYCILEHFADNSEELELSNRGMLLWGNLNYNFNEATMGYVSTSNFDWGVYTKRGWTQPNLITYMESHDEERLMYKNLNFGNNSNSSHNTRDLNTALKRMEEAAAFWSMIPGPKMLWQFGELGYDYSINYCISNGTINSNCRVDPKPIKWDYLQNANRKALYDSYSKFLKLRNISNFLSTFTTGSISYDFTGAFKKLQVTSDSLKITLIGNFDVVPQSGNVTFQNSGTWYNYITGATKTATGGSESINLQPGEYQLFLNKDVSNLLVTPIFNISPNEILKMNIKVFPNPVSTQSIIEYDLPESGQTTVELKTIYGQTVSTLFKGYRTKGKQQISLSNNKSIKNLPKGNYIIQLFINQKIKSKQIQIIN